MFCFFIFIHQIIWETALSGAHTNYFFRPTIHVLEGLELSVLHLIPTLLSVLKC